MPWSGVLPVMSPTAHSRGTQSQAKQLPVILHLATGRLPKKSKALDVTPEQKPNKGDIMELSQQCVKVVALGLGELRS